MPPPAITLAQFNRIATGKYNAGFVDFQADAHGNLTGQLAKVNNHVHATGKNRAELSPERVLEVKEAFIAAMERASVPPERILEIRQRLGIAKEMDATGDKERLGALLTARYTPLSRRQVRELLDKYADHGRGFTDESRAAVTDRDARAAARAANLPSGRKATAGAVDRVNTAAALERAGGVDFTLTDVMSVLSTARDFAGLSAGRQHRVKGDGAAADDLRRASARDLGSSVATLFSVALRLLPTGVRESGEFTFLGKAVKLVKGGDGTLSAVVGQGVGKTTLRLGFDADTLVRRLVGRAAREQDALGGASVREMLSAAYAADVGRGLMASDRTSLTRHFAAMVLEARGKTELEGGETHLYNVAARNYNTGLLVQIAQRSLDGQLGEGTVIDTLQKLENYYGQMRQDTAKLPDDIKQILEGVAHMPIEPVANGEFIVRAPVVGDIQQHVAAIPPQNGPAPALPQDVSLADVKDFVADFVFSGDTMVADVIIDLPGEQMRRLLSDPKRIAAFAAIIRTPALLDAAAAPQIAGVLKAGFAALAARLDPAFAAAHGGETLAQAAANDGFADRFAAFLRDPARLPGAVLAGFDDALDEMAVNACVKMQEFVNQVFAIHGGGVNVVKDPYSTMDKGQIKAELDGKSLNDILDSAATSEVPGQVGFFKQVVSTYFTSMDASDKRSCLAAALRYAEVFDFAGKQGEELQSAERAAINKFTGAILKGAGPLLHKMMQGLPKDIMGPYADALADMKQHLAPIPRKIVQAHLNKIIADSGGKIKSIVLNKSLGAASVGEAFLCTFSTVERRPVRRQLENLEEIFANGNDPWVTEKDAEGNVIYADVVETHSVVVKIMRHDAERRVEKEAVIFTAAAGKIPGMAKTWEGQLKQYMTEFDFRTEARNVQAGVGLYDIMDNNDHPLQAIAPKVTTMKLSPLAPSGKNVLIAEEMAGDTVDEYFKTTVSQVRNAASSVFRQDPATGRILWEEAEDPVTHQTVKRPLLRDNIPANSVGVLRTWLTNTQDKLSRASDMILQATKVWFYNALLGDGKFHGDTHAGNLMITAHQVGFIDFGNLYTLRKDREDGVNEQQELLRVILGAAFRDKALVLKGFDKLMSAEGKARLADPAVRGKAEAILASVLSPERGRFAFNIVYRLQAAIIELQKLGLELPPPVNCFIQSLVRLSNTVTEINTIANQTGALLDATGRLDIPAPPDRDELDYLGRAFDLYASEAGRAPVPFRQNPDGSYSPVQPGDAEPATGQCPGYILLLRSPEFGGNRKERSDVFKENGEYTNKVVARLAGAADPVAEAEKLVTTFVGHTDAAHDNASRTGVILARNLLQALRADLVAAGGDAERKTQAIRSFARGFALSYRGVLKSMLDGMALTSNVPKVDPPSTFASAITDILFDNFNAVRQAVGADGIALYNDARGIVNNELHANVGFFDADGVVEAIKADAEHEGGDKSYEIKIGV